MASPNLDQIESLTGSRDIFAGCTALHERGLQNVVAHAGAEGAFISDGKDIDHVPPESAGPIIDVTGAGDAAVAGLVFGLLQGKRPDVGSGLWTNPRGPRHRQPAIHSGVIMQVQCSKPVAAALKAGKPVVALESTIIAHGMPFPQNLEMAREVERVITEYGATPATIAIVDGDIVRGP